MPSIRLLLVSGTSVVGQNLLAVLEGRRVDVFVAATGSVASDLTLFGFDAAYLVPETAAPSGAFPRRLDEVIEDVRPDLIIPCRDDDVLALARLIVDRPSLAPRVLCGTVETAVAICDKWESAVFSCGHGLPFVPSAATGPGVDLSSFVKGHGFPLIVKPRAGCGSRDIRILTSDDQVGAVAARPGFIVQPFLGDREAALTWAEDTRTFGIPLFHSLEPIKRAGQVLVTPDGTVEGLQCTRNTMRAGFSERVARDDDPSMHALVTRCARAFAAAGWRGPFNVQCLPDASGALLVHEFNGRFTGATAAQLLLGQDDLGLAVQRFTGRRLERARAHDGSAEEVVKVPRAYTPDPARLAQIQTSGRYVK